MGINTEKNRELRIGRKEGMERERKEGMQRERGEKMEGGRGERERESE